MINDRIVRRLHGAIAAAGIPVIGVADNGPDATPRFRIDLDPTGAPAQLAQAQQIAANFDTRPRASRTHASIMTNVMKLNPADSGRLFAAIAASWLQQDPAFATSLGIAVPGDQVEAAQ